MKLCQNMVWKTDNTGNDPQKDAAKPTRARSPVQAKIQVYTVPVLFYSKAALNAILFLFK